MWQISFKKKKRVTTVRPKENAVKTHKCLHIEQNWLLLNAPRPNLARLSRCWCGLYLLPVVGIMLTQITPGQEGGLYTPLSHAGTKSGSGSTCQSLEATLVRCNLHAAFLAGLQLPNAPSLLFCSENACFPLSSLTQTLITWLFC